MNIWHICATRGCLCFVPVRGDLCGWCKRINSVQGYVATLEERPPAEDYHGDALRCAYLAQEARMARGDGEAERIYTKRRASLGRGWRLLTERCATLHALVQIWAGHRGWTLKDVALKYVGATQEAIENWLSFAPETARITIALLPTWRDEAPSIMDSEPWQREEALRVCACAFEIRKQALGCAIRHAERNMTPAIQVTVPDATP